MGSKKVAVVTGVTSGIGKEVALGLIRQDYELHVIARNESKFNELKQQAQSFNPKARLTFYKADLSLVSSTTSILKEIKKELDSIDLLYQSAGLIPGKIELTEEGIEKTFAVSYLTRYLIASELLTLVLQSEQKLFVNMAGAGQNGKIYFDDVNFQNRKFKPMNVVKQFQQANDAMCIGFKEKYLEQGLKVYCLIPGLVDTGIHDGWPPFFQFFIRNILGRFIMVSAEEAAKVPLALIDNSLVPQSVLVNEKGKPIKPSSTLLDATYIERVIDLSIALIQKAL